MNKSPCNAAGTLTIASLLPAKPEIDYSNLTAEDVYRLKKGLCDLAAASRLNMTAMDVAKDLHRCLTATGSLPNMLHIKGQTWDCSTSLPTVDEMKQCIKDSGPKPYFIADKVWRRLTSAK